MGNIKYEEKILVVNSVISFWTITRVSGTSQNRTEI